MAATQPQSTEFPYSLTISLPLPSHRLASSALRALEVDAELSPLVRRDFALKCADTQDEAADGDEGKTVLETTYMATTNRMLRVAVNGFMESLGVVLGVMEELDVDVLEEESKA
ncbi:CTAG/PCC1 family protein [Aspergillus lucknowensis]|uniref:Transcription factor Pcc1-domain-containing protein n=1 Tax=Aspergillus lucknowensis TaxID=176173 RepID=A0ABR4LRA0_9EURO